MANLKNLGKRLTDLFNSANNAVSAPFNNLGAQLRQGGQQPIRIAPQVQPFRGNSIPAQGGNMIANIPSMMANSIVGQGIVSPISDLTHMAGRAAMGRQLPTYDSLRSPQARLGYNIQNVQNTRNPQQIIGNIAGSMMPIADAWAPGGVKKIVESGAKQILKQSFKQAVKTGVVHGGLQGGAYGLAQGLAEGRTAPNLGEQARQGLGGAMAGTVVGGSLGAILAGGGHLSGEAFNAIVKAYKAYNPTVNETQAREGAQKFVRDSFGQFAKKNKGEPAFYGDMRESLGLPRNGLNDRGGFIKPDEFTQGKNPVPGQPGIVPPTKPLQSGELPFSNSSQNSITPITETVNGKTVLNDQGKKKVGDLLYESTPYQKTTTEKISPQTLTQSSQPASPSYLDSRDSLGKVSQTNTAEAELLKGSLSEKVRQQSPGAYQALEESLPKAGMDVKKKVSALDYFRTPEHVLKKIGLEDESKNLRTSFEGYQKDLKTEISRITDWSKQAPGEEASRNIFRYLDGESVPLAPNEQKVADEIRPYLEQWANKLGLAKDRQISHYITHIFEQDLVQKEFDDDLARIIRDKIPGSVYDPFLQERLGGQGYVQDVWRALDAYVKRGTRKFNMDPALSKMALAGEKLDIQSFNYVKSLGDRINMRPTDTDVLVDNLIKQTPIGYKYGNRPVAVISRKIRQTIYRSTLGLNLGSALKNLTQGANTYAELGEKNTVKGYMDLARRGTKELYDEGVLDDNLIQDRKFNAVKSFWEKADKGLFYFFETAEKINRGSAYYGAKAKAIGEGMDERQAVEYAKELVRKTQFAFGSIDAPVALSGDVAKTFTQLQSYTIKQSEFLADKAMKKDLAGLMRYAGANMFMVFTVGQALGMKPQDMVPSFRLETPLFKVGGAIKDSLSLDPDTRQQGQDDFVKSMYLGVPAGSQIKKSVEGLTSANQGYSASKSGRVQYPIPQDPVTKARATAFGKSALPQAQEYYDKKRQVLGEKQTETYKALPPERKQNYYDSIIKGREMEKEPQKMTMGADLPVVDEAIDKVKGLFKLKETKPTVYAKLSPEEKKAQDELFKITFKQSDKGQAKQGDKLYIKKDDGGVKVVDLAAANSSGNLIQQAKASATKQNAISSTGTSTYFSQSLSQSDKDKIYKELGTNAQDVEMKALASLNDNDQAGVLHKLLEERKWDEGKVNKFIDSNVLTNNVVAKMAEGGLISQDQTTTLKAYIKAQNIKTGKIKGPAGKKPKKMSIKIAATKAPKTSTFKLKLSKPGKIKNPKNTVKISKSKQAKPVKYKISKTKTNFSSKYRLTS